MHKTRSDMILYWTFKEFWLLFEPNSLFMSSNKPLVILGSARKDSNTLLVIENLLEEKDYTFLNLSDYVFVGYDYDNNYPENDQFLEIVDDMLAHDKIIFATPVYWYAMSSVMKTHFDRWSDLVRVEKPKGRAMAGKETFLVTQGSSDHMPLGFEVPFDLSSKYLDMNFKGYIYGDMTLGKDHFAFDDNQKTAFLDKVFH